MCIFDRQEKCMILKEQNCPGCPFAKSEEQLVVERASAALRLVRINMWAICKEKYGI